MDRDRLSCIDHRDAFKNYITNTMKRWDRVKETASKSEIVFSRLCVFTAAGAQVLSHLPVANDIFQQISINGAHNLSLGNIRNAALYGALGGAAVRAVVTGIANSSKSREGKTIIRRSFQGTEFEEQVNVMKADNVIKGMYPELDDQRENHKSRVVLNTR